LQRDFTVRDVRAYLLVIERGRCKTGRSVAWSAIAWHTLVCGWGIMAAGTCSRCPLENAAAVAAIASQLLVHTGELKFGVVELGRHPAGWSVALSTGGSDSSQMVDWHLVAGFASR